MGSNERPNEQPLHPVQVDSFDMAVTEVTVRQFRAFVQATAYQTDAERSGHSFLCCWRPKIGVNWRLPGFPQGDDEPAVAVSWNDAVAFAEWLSAETGDEYRLPSEAEWEYACRSASVGSPARAIDEIAWYNANSEGHTHPVGTKTADGWGLFDLRGNAWEWCQDVYHTNYQGAPANSAPWMTGGDAEGRVLRGGSWGLCDCKHPVSFDLSPSSRPVFPRGASCNNSGFRLARSLRSGESSTAKAKTDAPSFEVRGVRFETVSIPGGEFSMGSDTGDLCERPAHPVRSLRPVRLGRAEVTVAQFRVFVEATQFVTDAERQGWAWDSNFRRRYSPQKKSGLFWRNPGFAQTDEHPVTCVSWNDAAAFCRWLSKETGRHLRLPSEAEWEYACRYGQAEPEKSKLPEFVWYAANSELRTHPVAGKKPNPAGVYDLLGNVTEWVEDIWHPNYAGGPSDGSSWLGDPITARVCRGGCFEREPNEMGSTGRDWYEPSEAIVGGGFRFVDTTIQGSGD
jgi:formylglycine-generating enzyme required for sulfatase activity